MVATMGISRDGTVVVGRASKLQRPLREAFEGSLQRRPPSQKLASPAVPRASLTAAAGGSKVTLAAPLARCNKAQAALAVWDCTWTALTPSDGHREALQRQLLCPAPPNSHW